MNETINIISNVAHTNTWEILIVVYFYVVGLSAGVFLISCLYSVFKIEIFKPIAKSASALAVILLPFVGLVLIAHLGRSERFYTLFYNFNPTSVMAWGAYILTLFSFGSFAYAYYLFKGNNKKARLTGIISIPLALAVYTYTGFEIGVVAARAFWYSPLMGTHFFVTSITASLSLMILVSFIQDKYFKRALNKNLLLRLSKLLIWFLVLDLFFISSMVVVLLNGGSEAVASVKMALNNHLLQLEILLGMILPLFLLVFPKTRKSSRTIIVAAVLIIIFAFFVRYSGVMIGQAIPIS